MERKGWVVTIIIPTNCNNPTEYLEKALSLTAQPGFLAINIDSQNQLLHLVYDTESDAINARLKALEIQDIVIICGKLRTAIFDDQALTKEYQDDLKKENAINAISMAVEIEKLKKDGVLPS